MEERIRRYTRSFSSPDDVIELAEIRSELIDLGGLTVSHDMHEPGWRWSTHIRQLVGTTWCEVRHIGVILRGRMHFLLEDGTEFEVEPLSLIDVPAGHDAWVAGDDTVETISWTGVKGWLGPLESMTERVLATIVLTDIVDSTGTALRMGDRSWADTLAAFEARTRDVLGRFRGREIKMTGDGVLATFDGAARATRCAVALRAAAADLSISIRAAVHTGEIEIAGDDIRGLAVHEASRMLTVAGAGEILVSAMTAELSRDAGLVFDDRGEHELRGLSGSRHLFAIAG
jgi:class 3 adenylate cyclase